MSHTKNGKLIGQAAHAERREQAQYVADVQEVERKRKQAELAYTHNLAQEVADLMGNAYPEWWLNTPDDDAGFLAAVEAKHAQLMPCECSADDRDGACGPCRARNAATEMPF
jgi:uncharacterized protein (UPF0128 family)